VADRQIRATRLKDFPLAGSPNKQPKIGLFRRTPTFNRQPAGTITENRYYPRAYELNTVQQIT
jgi:hypothetical protein